MTAETSDSRAGDALFALSRALYRRLAPYISTEADVRVRQRVLDACEMTTVRLANEPDFADPERFLFDAIRADFPLAEQLCVRRTVEVHIAFARQVIERMPSAERPCPAFTRSGTPCQRPPAPGSDYCPSHRHLDKLDDVEQIVSQSLAE